MVFIICFIRPNNLRSHRSMSQQLSPFFAIIPWANTSLRKSGGKWSFVFKAIIIKGSWVLQFFFRDYIGKYKIIFVPRKAVSVSAQVCFFFSAGASLWSRRHDESHFLVLSAGLPLIWKRRCSTYSTHEHTYSTRVAHIIVLCTPPSIEL